MSEKSINPPDSSDSGLNAKAVSTEIKKFTYGDLHKFHSKQLKDASRPAQIVRNTSAAINKWLRLATWLNRGRAEGDPGLSASKHDFVGDELLIDFELCLEEYVAEHKKPSAKRDEKKGPYAEQTIYDRTGYMRAVYDSWLVLLKTDGLPDDFGGAIEFLCNRKNQTIYRTERLCALTHNMLLCWVTKKARPSYKSLKYITTLEDHFEVQHGALKARLPHILKGSRTYAAIPNRTPWRKHQGILSKKVYSLLQLTDGVLPEQVEHEWQGLHRFQTDGAWIAVQGLKRSPESTGWITRASTGQSRASQNAFLKLMYFYGYLCLPRQPEDPALTGVKFELDNEQHVGVRGLDPHLVGKGFDPAGMSLALFTVIDLIYDYIEFFKGRTLNNRYNRNVFDFLTFAMQLTRPKYGYLWQLPEFSSKLQASLPTSMLSSFTTLLRTSDEQAAKKLDFRLNQKTGRIRRTISEETDDERRKRRVKVWQTHCETAYLRLKEIMRGIQKDPSQGFKRSNDSIEVIKPLIRARQHPITILLEMADKLRRDVELTNNGEKKAVLFRTMLLIKIVASNPMRIENIANMKYKEGCEGNEEDECNLYKKNGDGSWHLKYEKWELKNGFRRGRYNLPIHQTVWKDIEEYVKVHRPKLVGSEECNYVFRHSQEYFKRLSPEEREILKTKPMNSHQLSDSILELSQMLIDDCLGFSAHTARHFAVTEWLKNNPGAYPVAAAILHDSEEMARNTYNWCEPDDMAPFWTDHFGKVVKKFEEGNL